MADPVHHDPDDGNAAKIFHFRETYCSHLLRKFWDIKELFICIGVCSKNQSLEENYARNLSDPISKESVDGNWTSRIVIQIC